MISFIRLKSDTPARLTTSATCSRSPFKNPDCVVAYTSTNASAEILNEIMKFPPARVLGTPKLTVNDSELGAKKNYETNEKIKILVCLANLVCAWYALFRLEFRLQAVNFSQ